MRPSLWEHSAKLVESELVAKNTYQLTFLLEDELSFVPGQYVWIELKEPECADRGGRRPFSICCSPNGRNSISIVFRESSSEYKKTLLSLPLQSQVNVYGPFGSLTLPGSPDTPVIFIAGGVGVAPFISIIRESVAKNSLRPIHLIYANTDPEKAVYISELRQMSKKHKTFTFQEVYRHITAQDLQNLSEFQNSIIYTTGPEAMVEAMGTLLVSLGVSKNKVRFEEFYPRVFAPANALYLSTIPITKTIFSLALQNTSNHIIITDIDGKIVFANKAAEALTGYSFEEMRGQTSRLWGGLMNKIFYDSLWQTIKVKQEPFSAKVYNRRKDGFVYTALIRISPILENDGKLIGFMGTEEDITELEKVGESKTEFVSLAAHQFRTPLTVIKWTIEELLNASGDGELKPSQRKNVEEIHQKTQEVIALIARLLQVSNLELGQYVVKLTPVNLPSIAEKVFLGCRSSIAEKGLKIKKLYSENLYEINSDANFIEIVLQNLISNAVKYTLSDGSLELEISLDKQKGVKDKYKIKGKNVFIRVSDTGIGIPKQQQSRVFQEFSRADNAKLIDATGSGFGLYMTKLIVEHLGGEIWFESEEGKGTTFCVLLPVQS